MGVAHKPCKAQDLATSRQHSVCVDTVPIHQQRRPYRGDVCLAGEYAEVLRDDQLHGIYI